MAWSRMPTGTRRAARPGEGVDVVDQVLAAHEQLSGGLGLVRREDAPLDQLVGRVAGHQARVRIQRVPAAGVVVDRRCAAAGRARRRTPCAAVRARRADRSRRSGARPTMPCEPVSHELQERSPRAGDGDERAAAVTLHAWSRSTQHRRHHVSASQDTLAPIAHRPGGGRAPLVLRRADDDQGRRRRDRRSRAGDRAARAARQRLAAARPPQRGRVVLRPRGRAHDLGRGQDDRGGRPARSCSARATFRTRSSSAPSRRASCW